MAQGPTRLTRGVGVPFGGMGDATPETYSFTRTHINGLLSDLTGHQGPPSGEMHSESNAIADGFDKSALASYITENNYSVFSQSNTTTTYHYFRDLSDASGHDLTQGQIVFMGRMKPINQPNAIGSTQEVMLGLSMFAWYLQYGEGRAKYGRSLTALPILEDWDLRGIKTSIEVDGDDPRKQGSENVTITVARRARAPNVWAVSERVEHGRIVNHVQAGDALYIILERVREENPYAANNADWGKDIQGQFYWRPTPKHYAKRVPGWYEYNSDNPDDGNAFKGHAWRVGLVHQQLDRYGENFSVPFNADKAVWPRQNSPEYLTPLKDLPKLEIMVKCI
jgi:hypothetical protein